VDHNADQDVMLLALAGTVGCSLLQPGGATVRHTGNLHLAAEPQMQAPGELGTKNWHLQPLCSEGCKASPTTHPPDLDNTHVSMLQEHVMELGKNSLDCLLIGELDLGRVCHCLGRPE
jgi:hypothetical protein